MDHYTQLSTDCSGLTHPSEKIVVGKVMGVAWVLSEVVLEDEGSKVGLIV
jgi:hypothetical protein